MNSWILSLLAALHCWSASADDVRIKTITMEEFRRYNPVEAGLLETDEALWAGGGSTGAHGGGSSRLAEIRKDRETFLLERNALHLTLGEVDWVNHPQTEIRRLFVERILLRDPVRLLNEEKIHFAEKCRNGDRKGPAALIVIDAPWSCVTSGLVSNQYFSIWTEILALRLENSAISEILSGLNRSEAKFEQNLSGNDRLRILYHLSLPVSENQRPTACETPARQGKTWISAHPDAIEASSRDVRRHPDGRRIYLLEDGTYAICR